MTVPIVTMTPSMKITQCFRFSYFPRVSVADLDPI